MTETQNTAAAAAEGHASCCQGGHGCGPAETPRRGLLIQGLTALISTAIMAIPATLGGLFFLDPILRRKQAAGGTGGGSARKDEQGFLRLDVNREAIPADGTPVSVTVF
ncbi:MAG: hypothetical protein ACKPJD_02120, partial [Planctomycetaceae bacterium]